jgi:hypothetical protein
MDTIIEKLSNIYQDLYVFYVANDLDGNIDNLYTRVEIDDNIDNALRSIKETINLLKEHKKNGL